MNADSIGEKFVRLPDRGAVAVLAASWRVDPSPSFNEALVRAMLQPGTVGEAVMRAKQATSDETQVALYNLLGDPAAPLAVPQHRMALAVDWREFHGWLVTATLEAGGFHGHAQIDWLDVDGAVVSRQQHEMTGSRMTATYVGQADQLAEIRAVRVYAWDADSGQDGLGWAGSADTSAAGSA